MSAVNNLMQHYQETRDNAAYGRLVSCYMPLVRFHAGKLAAGLPSHISREDLVQSGVLGLLEALQRFDQSRGIKFETFAGQRIRGAMLDELRRLCWLPRSLMRQKRNLDKKSQGLASSLGREPSEEEVAAEMGMTLADLQKTINSIHRGSVLSLEEKLSVPVPGSSAEGGTLDDLLAQEEKELLAKSIESLDQRYRLILALYYQEGLKLKEIGFVLGISESRVCQLHTRIIDKLRAVMRAQDYN
jgi:RNA polymerase sigma factor FliA